MRAKVQAKTKKVMKDKDGSDCIGVKINGRWYNMYGTYETLKRELDNIEIGKTYDLKIVDNELLSIREVEETKKNEIDNIEKTTIQVMQLYTNFKENLKMKDEQAIVSLIACILKHTRAK